MYREINSNYFTDIFLREQVVYVSLTFWHTYRISTSQKCWEQNNTPNSYYQIGPCISSSLISSGLFSLGALLERPIVCSFLMYCRHCLSHSLSSLTIYTQSKFMYTREDTRIQGCTTNHQVCNLFLNIRYVIESHTLIQYYIIYMTVVGTKCIFHKQCMGKKPWW
jgi:hypothetical protein